MSPPSKAPRPLDKLLALIAQAEEKADQAMLALNKSLRDEKDARSNLDELRDELKRRINVNIKQLRKDS